MPSQEKRDCLLSELDPGCEIRNVTTQFMIPSATIIHPFAYRLLDFSTAVAWHRDMPSRLEWKIPGVRRGLQTLLQR